MRVSVRELKTHLSKYLRLVRTRGQSVIVTSRDTAIARLSPVADVGATKLQQLLQDGLVRWNGGKPKGGRGRPRIAGRSAASRVLEDRG